MRPHPSTPAIPRRATTAIALLGTLILAQLVVPAPAVAGPANPDCDAPAYVIGGGVKNRVLNFRYLSGGAPVQQATPVVEAAIALAARSWTDQINDCGRPDRTNIQYRHSSTSTATGTRGANHGNGVAEVFWGCIDWGWGGCPYLAYAYSPAVGECDIVINNRLAAFNDISMSRPEYLATVLAHEMGHCVGIDHPPNTLQNKVLTVSASYCVDPRTSPLLDWWPNSDCGLTLGLGDMLAAERLFPS